MELLADGLLIATAMTAGLYCMVLSRRLRRLTESGQGIGAQIDALDRALNEAKTALTETREGVADLRSSAKATLADLARETARGQQLAEAIQSSIDDAKVILERLYETGEQIRAYDDRHRGGRQTASAAGGKSDGATGTGDATAGEALGPTVLLHELGPEATVLSPLSPGSDTAEATAPAGNIGPEIASAENALEESAPWEGLAGDGAAGDAQGDGANAEPTRAVLQAERVQL